MNRSRYFIIMGLLAVVSLFFGFNSFAANLQQTTLKVSNLSCGACLSRIDGTLTEYEGYSKLGADLRQGIVIVEHEKSLKEETIAKAITDIGYPAEVVTAREVNPKTNLFGNKGSRYGCCGGGKRYGGCGASASAWKRLFNRQPDSAPTQ